MADVDWACRELEWALARDARVLVMRPSAVYTRDGWRPPTHASFDPFWARVSEAGVTVVAHVGSNAYTANGYGGHSALEILGGGRKPTVAGLISERAIYDFLITFALRQDVRTLSRTCASPPSRTARASSAISS